jgi:hypothetical protein
MHRTGCQKGALVSLSRLSRLSLFSRLEEIERYSHELDVRSTLLKAKVRDADRQIIELENEVMRQRGRVQDWQDYIDEKLTEGQ